VRETPPAGYSMAADGLRIMRELGAPPDDIAAAEAVVAAEQLDEDFEVHEDNWDLVQVFCRLSTQWSYEPLTAGVAAGMAMQIVSELRRTGFKYEGVRSGLWLMGLPVRQQRAWFGELQVMEAAVLEADAELREQRRT
jgi:hypothetical protein